VYWSGSHHISAATSSWSAAASLLPTPRPSCVEYRRDRSSDRYYSCSTQQTYCGSLSITICGHTCTLTICRSMASAVQQQPLSSRSKYLHVSTTWMQSNRFQLNTAKTKVIWCASNRRQHQLPQVDLRVGTDHVTPTTSVHDLGIYVDCDVLMRTHVSRTVSSCFAVLRQLRSIRRSVSPAVLQSLVMLLVLSCLDYGNATLAGLPGNRLDRLQSVIKAAAQLTCSTWKYEHITPLLRDLHWLPVRKRIEFKLAVLVFCCLHGMALHGGHRRKKTAAFCINICSRHTIIASFDDWWLGLLRRCSARLEQLAIQRHCITDTRHLQSPAEDTSFRCLPYLTHLYWTCAAQFFCNVDWCTVFLKFFYLTTL